MYPKQFVDSPGNPAMEGVFGNRWETNGYPVFYNLHQDPREKINVGATHAWLIAPYLKAIQAYLKTLEAEPIPGSVNMTSFER